MFGSLFLAKPLRWSGHFNVASACGRGGLASSGGGGREDLELRRKPLTSQFFTEGSQPLRRTQPNDDQELCRSPTREDARAT